MFLFFKVNKKMLFFFNNKNRNLFSINIELLYHTILQYIILIFFIINYLPGGGAGGL